MHIETLKVFCDLVDLESFSLAAERNFITQSAVSQQIRRSKRNTSAACSNAYAAAARCTSLPPAKYFTESRGTSLTSYDHLEESLRGLVGKIGGTIKVSTVYSVGLHELPSKVREFMTKFPTAKIDLEYSRTTRVVRDVLNGTVELGILAFPEPRRGITIVPMPSHRLVLIVPPDHKFAKRSKLKVTDLQGQDFVHFERDVPTRKAMDKTLRDHDVEVNKVAEFDNIETIKRAVEVGFGIAIVPQPAVIEAAKAGMLAVIKLAEKEWDPAGRRHLSQRPQPVARGEKVCSAFRKARSGNEISGGCSIA